MGSSTQTLEQLQPRSDLVPTGGRLMVPDCTRTRALSVLIALFATATLVHGQEPKQMAITFDDLPFAYARNLTIADQREAVARVLTTLDKHRVTATVFVLVRLG